jgi:hypothetical protein
VIGWVTAFLDTAAERSEAAEVFWSRVTGHRVSPRRGERAEFATLLPADGDPYLRLQRVVQSPPAGLHLDLHTGDVDGLAARVERLGGTASYLPAGYVVCGSPGGMTFCVVGEPGSRRPAPVPWPGGRGQVDQVCLDVPPDAWESEGAFWEALTGWPRRAVADHDEFQRLRVPPEQPLRLLLQRLEDAASVVTGHLDLAADDRDAEVARHVALGARVVARHPWWTVLAEPGGHRRYCVTGRRTEVSRPAAPRAPTGPGPRGA